MLLKLPCLKLKFGLISLKLAYIRKVVIMKKLLRGLVLMLSFVFLSGCAQLINNDEQPQWDFDHKVQYRQTKLTATSYHLVIIPQTKTRFSRLATFLLRRSKDLCHSYGFKIEVLSGIRGFNENLGAPNLLMSSLKANVECVAE